MKMRFPLVALLPLFFCCTLPFAWSGAPEHPGLSAPATVEETCPAPAPTGLGVLYMTPTTANLVWIGGVGEYYMVEIYDLTTSTPLSPVYVTTENALITGLTPAHCYRFWVSASYCPGGPYGSRSSNADGCTGLIIIDDVVEFSVPNSQPITPSLDSNAVFSLCIKRSDTTSTHHYNEAGIMRIAYYKKNTYVGIALPSESNDLHANLKKYDGEDNSNFKIESYPSPGTNSVTAILKFTFDPKANPVVYRPILRYTYAGISLPTDPQAIAQVDIRNLVDSISVLEYYPTGTCANPPSLVHAKGDPSRPAAHLTNRPESEQSLITHSSPTPNPFSDEALFDYELLAPSPVSIRLYDAMGRLTKDVWEGWAQDAGAYQARIPGANLPNGVYFLHVRIDGELKIYRLVKQE